MRTAVPTWLKLSCFALLISGLVLAIGFTPERPDRSLVRDLVDLRGEWVGRQVPDFTLQTLSGETFTMSQLRGRVVFLNLWATWCPPCVEEIPDMVKLAKNMETDGERFLMLAVSWDTDLEDVSSFVKATPGMAESMVLAHDADGRLTRQLGTRSLPESYVIDKNGVIQARFQGPRPWGDREAQKMLKHLLRQE